MPEIFFIGATGHVGGAVLDQIYTSHPDVTVHAQARNENLAEKLVKKYPKIKTSIGDLGKLDQDSVHAADIVINTAPDITHDEELKTLLSKIKDSAYYIHTAGASIIWDEPKGNKDAKTWDDIEDIAALIAREQSWTHGPTDAIVRAAWPRINIAIMSPTWISGPSPSVGHPTPLSHPGFILAAKSIGSGFEIAQGENRACYIDVRDLAAQYLLLVADALAPTPATSPFPRWGPDAYYFGASEELSHREFMAGIVGPLHRHGVIASTEVRSVDVAEAARMSIGGPDYDPDTPPPPPDSWAVHIAIGAGINMRVRASRMRALGWTPTRPSVLETWEETLVEILEKQKAEVAK